MDITSGLKKLLIANIVIFILQQLVSNYLLNFFALWPITTGKFYLWQIVTSLFLHGGFMHIFFNMLILYMFGRDLEIEWGEKRFLTYYFICGVGESILCLMFDFITGNKFPSIGASGAIFGVLVAFAYLFPNRLIYLYFVIPVKAKYVIIGYVVLEIYLALFNKFDGVGHIAHICGALVGFIYLNIIYKSNFRLGKKLDFVNDPTEYYGNPNIASESVTFEDLEKYREETREKFYPNDEKNQNIDDVLMKMTELGYDSLTNEEKEILKRGY